MVVDVVIGAVETVTAAVARGAVDAVVLSGTAFIGGNTIGPPIGCAAAKLVTAVGADLATGAVGNV